MQHIGLEQVAAHSDLTRVSLFVTNRLQKSFSDDLIRSLNFCYSKSCCQTEPKSPLFSQARARAQGWRIEHWYMKLINASSIKKEIFTRSKNLMKDFQVNPRLKLASATTLIIPHGKSRSRTKQAAAHETRKSLPWSLGTFEIIALHNKCQICYKGGQVFGSCEMCGSMELLLVCW